MTSRLGRLSAVLLLVAALLIPATTPTTAHTEPTFNHYEASCNTGSESGSHGKIWHRAVGVGFIKGVRGQLVAQDLHPCTNGDGNPASLTLVLPVNLQGHGSGGSGGFQFAQFGIGSSDDSVPTGCGSEGMRNNGQTDFVYTTVVDDGIGYICRADWVDFNNDGNTNNPLPGEAYTMSVEEYNVGTDDYWRFCITRISKGLTSCHNENRGSIDGGISSNTTAWWGCEVLGKANAQGSHGGTADVHIRSAGYKKTDNQWYYTEESNVYYGWDGISVSYYHSDMDQSWNPGEDFTCETALHQ